MKPVSISKLFYFRKKRLLMHVKVDVATLYYGLAIALKKMQLKKPSKSRPTVVSMQSST